MVCLDRGIAFAFGSQFLLTARHISEPFPDISEKKSIVGAWLTDADDEMEERLGAVYIDQHLGVSIRKAKQNPVPTARIWSPRSAPVFKRQHITTPLQFAGGEVLVPTPVASTGLGREVCSTGTLYRPSSLDTAGKNPAENF